MRVLVEQTVRAAQEWVDRAAPWFREQGLAEPAVWQLMGGEVEADWALEPEKPAVIVGTQDMLLSRALLRGYGMSRYQWPVHFAFLHNDTLWIFDEIQLMGPGLPTSAQLEGFRRRFGTARPSKSIWMSATLRKEWLETIDLREHVDTFAICQLGPEDEQAARPRLHAKKSIRCLPEALTKESAKSGAKAYLKSLAEQVLEKHRPGTQTLVILNRVARAQALYRLLRNERPAQELLLVHARFRPADRRALEETLRKPASDRIIVATQAVEAGVDISSTTLITELAPWESLVQRFGRCNRFGEQEKGGQIWWIDISDDAEEADPYHPDRLSEARTILRGLRTASPLELPPPPKAQEVHQVIRKKDFLELFDTEPDLTGFDLDVSRYIRDSGRPQVFVFWRNFEDRPRQDIQASRQELCPVSLGQLGEFFSRRSGEKRSGFWTWDPLEERWIFRRAESNPRPGSVLLLHSNDGGYTNELGFDPSLMDPVEDSRHGASDTIVDGFRQEEHTGVGFFLSLADHTKHVQEETRGLAHLLNLSAGESELLTEAALWHDVGKAHPAFQTALLERGAPSDPSIAAGSRTLWAKAPGSGRLRFRVPTAEGEEDRRYFRHELASLLAWSAHNGKDDRVAYMIASHHGKVRMALKALPDEPLPKEEDRLFARGVWEGDRLPPVSLPGLELPETVLSLELMLFGSGAAGPSWTERAQTLLDIYGPFRLAWWEALLRVADVRASIKEQCSAAETSP